MSPEFRLALYSAALLAVGVALIAAGIAGRGRTS